MPLHFRENQYRGVNAHLHSLLQHDGGGWEMFHSAHITHLTDALDALLPAGYYVLNEKSLQLSVIGTDYERRSVSRQDVAIYRTDDAPTVNAPSASGASVAVIPLTDTLIEEAPLESVVIYRIEGEAVPVTRIEVLSPANKPSGSHYRNYLSKRQETLKSGINLVEIDYLHESRPVVPALRSYPDAEAGAFPYTILVNNPHPTWETGKTTIYGFGVDDPIPPVLIPLAGDSTLSVDFGAVYEVTFSRNRYYGLVAVDYSQLPAAFDRYSAADQTHIRERMKAAAASQEG